MVHGNAPIPAGRRVVLTGATGGLGRMLAPAFVAAGARLALVARGREALESMAVELGGDTIAIAADTTDADDNDRIAAEVCDRFGGLDVWVANAGICHVVGGPRDISPEDFRLILDVNLTGSFLGARAASGVMGEGGRIIMTSSVLGERPRRGFAAYAASKAGMTGLVKALALDLASAGITVNAVAPGWFDSPLAEPWMQNGKLAAEILGHVPMRRWGDGNDLCGVFLFLASEASRFITGTVVPVDGGYLLA